MAAGNTRTGKLNNNIETFKMKINLKQIFNKKVVIGLGIATGIMVPASYEAMNSPWQAHIGTNVSQNKSGFGYKSTFVTTPREALSPMDIQRGEASDQQDSQRLRDMNFSVSGDLGHWDHSIFGVKLYSLEHPKMQAGLTLKGANGEVIYQAKYPRQVFKDFNDIPELWWRSLLYVENRELLDHQMDDKNVTVELDRLALAVFKRMGKKVGLHTNGPGGSGIIVQLEKLQRSPGGRTADEKAKLRQILTAMVKYYKDKDAKQFVVEYFNLVPLASTKLDGEVAGFAEGMEIWFGRDIEKVKTLLKTPDNQLDTAGLKEKADIYREALALVGAVKMPDSYYNGPRKRGAHLSKEDRALLGHKELDHRIDDIFIPILRDKANLITPEFAALTAADKLKFADQSTRHEPANPSPYKYVNNLRIKTQQTMKIGSLYDLERRDVTATVTAIPDLNRAAENICKLIQDPAYAKANGLVGGAEGKFLFDERDLPYIKCAMIINSRSDDGRNLSRVLTDNDTASPMNLVSGGRQGMGSTSKYRWGLLPYETSMYKLYNKYHEQTPEQLRARLAQVNFNDNHTRWALNRLLDPLADNSSFDKFLDAALERNYSGNPGGTPVENFDRKENSWNVSVRKNFHHSVNAAFWRIMRDNVNFVIYEEMGIDQAMFDNKEDPRRDSFLDAHTLTEGSIFLGRAMQEQTGKTAADTVDFLVKRSTARSPEQLAALFRYIYPEKSVAEMKTFILANTAEKYLAKLADKPSDKTVETVASTGKAKKIRPPKVRVDPFDALYKAFEPGHYDQSARTRVNKKTGEVKTYPEVYDLNERRYKIFGNTMHPLAFWLAKYRIQHPDASFTEIEKAAQQADGPSGKSVFRQSYGWLYAPTKTAAQNRSIFGAIRYKAFNDYLGPQQQALGYPFKRIVPDERIVLGSNGDTPEALATLLGIIQDDGMMRKLETFISINRFEDTEHVKTATRNQDPGHRAVPIEVARSLRKELQGVVEEGTGARLKYAFQIPNPNGPGKLVIPNGGKTGSDDGKLKGKDGSVVDVKSRTATWTFIIGDRVYGTVFLYIDGKPVQEAIPGNTPPAKGPKTPGLPSDQQNNATVNQQPVKTRIINPAARAHFTSATAVITTKLLFATPEFQKFISQEFTGKAIEGAVVIEEKTKVPARQAPAKPVAITTPRVATNDTLPNTSPAKAPSSVPN